MAVELALSAIKALNFIIVSHDKFLEIAYQEAQLAAQEGEQPAGAVLVKSGEIVAQSHDHCRQQNDPVARADLDCIRRAGRRSDQSELTFYLTSYPSMIGAGTILQFSIGQLIVGLAPIETDAISLLQNKQVPISFIPHQGCQSLNNE